MKLSRTKIEAFVQCPLCFYLDVKLGVSIPSQFPYHINNTIDHLLKKEFDMYRVCQSAHPLMEVYGVDAVPFAHAELSRWRDALHYGLQFEHVTSGFLVTGAPDDIWVDSDGKLLVVDYKATSTVKEISKDYIYASYGRQVEVYQWLLRGMGFVVRDLAYFVYCNGMRDKEAFDGQLEFSISLLEYQGDDSWVESVLFEIRDCLDSSVPPRSRKGCPYCAYSFKRAKVLR